MKIAMPGQMKEMDQRTVKEGYFTSLELMENAAQALYRVVSAIMEERGITRVVLLAGTGNNGGDAYALACLLDSVYQPSIIAVGSGERTPDCMYYYRQCLERGIPFIDDPAGFPLVVDGVFGTGFHGTLSPEIQQLFKKIHMPVVAIDLPSGMDGKSGCCAPGTLQPEYTVTFAYKKPCHLLADCGKVVLADIGIPSSYEKGLSRSELIPLLPRREEWGHKNSYGSVGLLVGAATYPGAAALALTGALQSGAGLVFGYLPRFARRAAAAKFYGPVLAPVRRLFPLRCGSYLAGSGLGRSRAAGRKVRALWKTDRPLVIDGDGLWHLQKFLDRRSAPTILTPHLGEFSRLAGIEKEELLQNRIEYAEEFAKRYGCILVLKDAATLITDGDQTQILSAPCSALAKGGSGDLLAGLIAGLLAGGGAPFSLAATGVYLHNRAARLAAAEHSARSVQPEMIARYLDRAWMELEHGTF